MKKVAVYANERRTNALSKESLIYESINLALDSMPDVARQSHEVLNAEAQASRPGLREVRSHEKIIALGRAAHTVLADYRKRTLVACGDDEERLDEDLGRLVWSCVNTSKVIALGQKAWQSVQMLPIAERRFYEVPPLQMAPLQNHKPTAEVLVINHEDDDIRARQVGDVLTCGGYQVQRTGRGNESLGGIDHCGWSATADIHVHVGCHDSRADELRLLDSWHSRRFVILLLPRRWEQESLAERLLVESEVNGFLCDLPEKVLVYCAELRTDAVLRKKMLHAGTISAAPLAREWLTIATELVS